MVRTAVNGYLTTILYRPARFRYTFFLQSVNILFLSTYHCWYAPAYLTQVWCGVKNLLLVTSLLIIVQSLAHAHIQFDNPFKYRQPSNTLQHGLNYIDGRCLLSMYVTSHNIYLYHSIILSLSHSLVSCGFFTTTPTAAVCGLLFTTTAASP